MDVRNRKKGRHERKEKQRKRKKNVKEIIRNED